MTFLITVVVLAFVSWMIGVITEKSSCFIATALFLASGVIFFVSLVGIV